MYSRRSLDPSFVIPRPEEMNAAVPSMLRKDGQVSDSHNSALPQAPPRLEREDAGPLMRTLYTFQDKFDHHVQVGQVILRNALHESYIVDSCQFYSGTSDCTGTACCTANCTGSWFGGCHCKSKWLRETNCNCLGFVSQALH